MSSVLGASYPDRFCDVLVHSRSTEKYTDDWKYTRKHLVTGPPTEETLRLEMQEEVVAIGGGSVIDTAKIISTRPIIAIPTTLSGASRTSHAVYWEQGRKWSKETRKPTTIIIPEYLATLPGYLFDTGKADCICHAVESLFSQKANEESAICAYAALELMRTGEWLDASLLAGDAIEIAGTNVIHALSYALTSLYGVPHAKALAFLLPRMIPLFPIEGIPAVPCINLDVDVDIEHVIGEAFTYPKMLESTLEFNEETLLELLR